MIPALKRLILRTLADLGYVVLKRPDYDRLLAAIAPPVAGGGSSSEMAPAETVPPTAHADGHASPIIALEPDFQRFYDGLDSRCPLPLMRVHAVYSAVRYLTNTRIPGDIVDCGNGSSETLAVAGAALVALGETNRALILFDVSGDPTHRAESELALWGSPRELLSPRERSPHLLGKKSGWLPPELLASGYPSERIRIAYAPKESLDGSRPIAFLELTSESYPANRAAIRELVPRVPIGGVIAVEANSWIRSAHDAVTEFLGERGIDLLLHHVTSTYRIGVRAGIPN